jgi:CCR4-NOT transcription complex subunit 7/8
MYQGFMGAAGAGGMPVGLGNGLINGGHVGATPVAMVQESVRSVWRWNLEEQMNVLQELVTRYRFVSVDCKFPGIVARPIGTFKTTSEYHYQTLRSNVDVLQVVQVGLTLSDEYGNHPPGVSSWQFNFRFNVEEDMCSSEGLELLRQSGIEFPKHEVEGIDPFAFAELLISSGFVLDDQVTWITYHSGYDLGYLLSLMVNKEVPVEEKGFLKLLRTYFPVVYDVKYIIKSYKLSAKSQLHEVADEFQVRREVSSGSNLSQAGNDSLTTAGCFFEVRRIIGENNIAKVRGNLFGLGSGSEELENGTTAQAQTGTAAQNAANLFQFGKMGAGV